MLARSPAGTIDIRRLRTRTAGPVPRSPCRPSNDISPSHTPSRTLRSRTQLSSVFSTNSLNRLSILSSTVSPATYRSRSVTRAAAPGDNQEHAAEAKPSSVETQADLAIGSSHRAEQDLTRDVTAGDALTGRDLGSIPMAIELGTPEKLGQFATRGLGVATNGSRAGLLPQVPPHAELLGLPQYRAETLRHGACRGATCARDTDVVICSTSTLSTAVPLGSGRTRVARSPFCTSASVATRNQERSALPADSDRFLQRRGP
jgi:hypothetical protein